MSDPGTTIAFARRFQGVKESPAGSNMQRFGAWYGWNGVYWCAIYVSFVLWSTGVRFLDATTPKGFAYVPYIVAWGRKHGRISRTPHLGDLACAIDANGVPYHVELVTVIHGSGAFDSIGGNTGPANLNNGGMVLEHGHNAAGWVFVTPPYTHATPTPVPPRPRPAPIKNTSPITRNWALTTPLQRDRQILWAEQVLHGFGLYNGAADSTFGPMMDRAVRAFQSSAGITVDGVLGPITGTYMVMREHPNR